MSGSQEAGQVGWELAAVQGVMTSALAGNPWLMERFVRASLLVGGFRGWRGRGGGAEGAGSKPATAAVPASVFGGGCFGSNEVGRQDPS